MSLEEALAGARDSVAQILAGASSRGTALPAPPDQPDPRTCCGRGCHPCMFTYYFDALELWRADAGRRLTGA